jgi:uncharacterized protein YndB with AHSA1/START domain
MAISTFVANATITVNAPIARVWDALVNPEIIKKYMFDTNVISKWTVGSSITWSGMWQGRKYEDKGVILRLEPRRLIQYTHFSPLSGLPDVPENYHTVTIELSRDGKQTHISLMQDHNATEEEREYSQANWKMMLEALKKVVE